MSDTTWKALERRIARRFGQERNIAQNRLEGGPDLIIGGLEVNVKHRREIPGWMTEALDSEPIVIWHGKFMEDDDCVVTVRLTTLERLLAIIALDKPETS